MACHVVSCHVMSCNTVKSHFKALGLYNFIRSFGWAYKRGGGGAISGWAYKRNKKNVTERRDKNVSEKRIKTKIQLNFKLHLLCVTING